MSRSLHKLTFMQICLFSVAATAASLLPSFAFAAVFQDERALRTLEASVDDPKALDVEVMNGSIKVVHDESLKSMQVTVVFRGEPANHPNPDDFWKCVNEAKLVTDRDANGQVRVRIDFPKAPQIRFNPPSTEVTIRTPGLSKLRAETLNGDVHATGELGSLELNTSNGDLKIQGTMSPIEAQTINGEIHITVREGSDAVIKAETTNGSTSIELPRSWDGSIEAATTLGRIEVTDIEGRTKRNLTGATFRRESGAGSSAKATLNVTHGSIKVKRS